jgi:stage II sporulation protein D
LIQTLHSSLLIAFAACLWVTTLHAEEGASSTLRVAILRDVAKYDQVLTKLCSREYQGTVRVVKNKDGTYSAINIVDLENYLLDVIGREMDPRAPLEALKAQAIAARSHALYMANISDDQPYDLIANLSQAYFGKEKLKKNIVLAIETTRGQILYFENKPLPAYFHSSCGGHTESVSTVWQNTLNSKWPGTTRCTYCAKSPETKWSFELSVASLQRVFATAGYKLGTSPAIEIQGKGIGGHAITVRVRSEMGEFSMSAEKFRSLLGYSNLKSTLFQVERERHSDGSGGDLIRFQGFGYGHGVGLCQFGAQEMAESGARCPDILNRYFPGCKVRSYEKDRLISSR